MNLIFKKVFKVFLLKNIFLNFFYLSSINPLNGPFSTLGNQIINTRGQSIRLKGISWFGFETNTLCPHGLWVRNYKNIMDHIKSLGFNVIRMPFCNQMFDLSSKPNSINYNLNVDLKDLNCMQILDKVVGYAQEIGIYIILDHHRSNIGAGPNENGLWYTNEYPESRFIDDWKLLAKRYLNTDCVIGADIHNEPKGQATWGTGDLNTDWHAAAQRTGNAILEVNPKLLIIVEGIESYNNNHYWWGGNLMGVKNKPVQLAVNNKVVYCPHDYPNSVWPQPWFSDSTFPNNLPQIFTKMWGYIFQENIAPLIIGEFGTRLQDPKDVLWLTKIMNCMNGDFTGTGQCNITNQNQGISWIWWCFNPNSSDTGGMLADDWVTIHQNKMNSIAPIILPDPCNNIPTNISDEFLLDSSYTVDKDWNNGYQVIITLNNRTSKPTRNWKVKFDLKENEIVSSICNADYNIQSRHVTISNPLWVDGNIIPSGGSTTLKIVITNVATSNRELINFKAVANYSTPITTPSPVVTPIADSINKCFIEYKIINQWANGYVANVIIKNNGNEPIKNWDLNFSFIDDQKIVNIWDAKLKLINGKHITITNEAWNSDIPVGNQIQIGFQVSDSGNNRTPVNFSLNGIKC